MHSERTSSGPHEFEFRKRICPSDVEKGVSQGSLFTTHIIKLVKCLFEAFMSFYARKESRAEFDTLERFALLVKTSPGRLRFPWGAVVIVAKQELLSRNGKGSNLRKSPFFSELDRR